MSDGREGPPLRVALVVASTRSEGRFADLAVAWLHPLLLQRDDMAIDLIDLREHALPPYDLALPPARAARRYESPEHREIGERFDAADGFLVLTNEFNHGYSAALKNVLDHFFVEFQHKPIAFVGYGNVGGARAIEQLRQVAAELDMVSVRDTVNIVGAEMRSLRTGGAEAAHSIWAGHAPKLTAMLDNLEWWGQTARAGRRRNAR